jgi:hypothetical protein
MRIYTASNTSNQQSAVGEAHSARRRYTRPANDIVELLSRERIWDQNIAEAAQSGATALQRAGWPARACLHI